MRFIKLTLAHTGGEIWLDTARIISFQSDNGTDLTTIAFDDTSDFVAKCEVTDRIQTVSEKIAIAGNAALKVGS